LFYFLYYIYYILTYIHYICYFILYIELWKFHCKEKFTDIRNEYDEGKLDDVEDWRDLYWVNNKYLLIILVLKSNYFNNHYIYIYACINKHLYISIYTFI